MTSEAEKKEIDEIALDWLATLQSDSLTPEEEQQFYDWLEADEANQKAYIAAEHLWQRGEALAHAQNMQQSAVDSLNIKPKPNRRVQYFWLSSAAMLLVAALTSVFFLSMEEQVPSPLSYATRLGEQQTVALPEGSSITLNTQTKVDVVIGLEGERRVTLKEGEVFFNVASNPDKPFKVRTPHGMVKVLGTQFAVYQKGLESSVTVLEGEVALYPGTDRWEESKEPIILSTNESLSLGIAESVVKKVDSDKLLSWRAKMLYFEGQPLSEVVEALNRYYGKSIILQGSDLNIKPVYASLSLESNFSDNLALLKASLNLSESSSSAASEIILRAAN